MKGAGVESIRKSFSLHGDDFLLKKCAGGDIRAIYDDLKARGTSPHGRGTISSDFF